MVAKCYHCKIIGLTNIKQMALAQEYENLQHYLQTGEDKGLYSANKQQAGRFYKVVKTGKKYPLSIRNDLIRIKHNPNTIAEYWCRIPVKIVRGGLWIGIIRPYEPIPKDAKICESKLYKRDTHWFLDVVVEKEVSEKNRIPKCNWYRYGDKTHSMFCGHGYEQDKIFWKKFEPYQRTLLLVEKKVRHEEST